MSTTTTTASDTKKLLLIFRRADEDNFWLVNGPGLPVSGTSPLIQTAGKTLVFVPALLTTLTEIMKTNEKVFGGYFFVMSWNSWDFEHTYVLLEQPNPIAVKAKDKEETTVTSTWTSNWDWDAPSNTNKADNGNDNATKPVYTNDANDWSYGNDHNMKNSDDSHDTKSTISTTGDDWGVPTPTSFPPSQPTEYYLQERPDEFSGQVAKLGGSIRQGGGGAGFKNSDWKSSNRELGDWKSTASTVSVDNWVNGGWK